MYCLRDTNFGEEGIVLTRSNSWCMLNYCFILKSFRWPLDRFERNNVSIASAFTSLILNPLYVEFQRMKDDNDK